MQNPARQYYQFREFRIDVADRQLLRNNILVPITPKVFDLLFLLVQSSGHVLSKEELMGRLWPDSFVEEGNLTRNISTLRSVLGDDRTNRLIETAPKRGYRFSGDVREVWEDDDSILIENRTRYQFRFSEEITTNNSIGTIYNSVTKTHRFVLAVVILVVAFGAIGWAIAARTRTNQIEAATLVSKKPEAIQQYQEGVELWRKRTVAELHQATILLERAVNDDPNFALAHSALANAYAFDYTNWKKAEAEARKAIELDPSLGQPHASIGFIRTFWEWRLYEAEEEFKRAIELSPEDATSHQWYALNLAATGHAGAGLGEMRRALELDPTSIAINGDMCQMLYFNRRYDEAINQCRYTLDMDPDNLDANTNLLWTYIARKMEPEARQVYFHIADINNNLESDLAKYRYNPPNDPAEFWRAHLRIADRSPMNSYQKALLRSHLGETDNTVAELQKAYDERDFGFVMIVADPLFDKIRLDPRFYDLEGLLADPGIR